MGGDSDYDVAVLKIEATGLQAVTLGKSADEMCIRDRTGTLTYATPRVAEIVPFGGRDPQEMLRLAACLEQHYPHSMANAVVEEARTCLLYTSIMVPLVCAVFDWTDQSTLLSIGLAASCAGGVCGDHLSPCLLYTSRA